MLLVLPKSVPNSFPEIVLNDACHHAPKSSFNNAQNGALNNSPNYAKNNARNIVSISAPQIATNNASNQASKMFLRINNAMNK